MTRSLGATLLQLTGRGYLLAGFGATSALTLVTVMLFVGSTDEAVEERGPLGDSATLSMLNAVDGLGRAMGSTISLVGLVVMALSASVVAADYSTGMVRMLAVRQPNRIALLAGKCAALGVASAVITVVVVVTAAVAAVLFAPPEVDVALWFSGEGLAALGEAAVNYFVAALGWSVLGQMVATLTRSAVVALATGITLAIPLDLVLSDTVESSRRWLPGQLLQAVARGGTRNLNYGASLITVLAASVAAVLVSCIVFSRRDISS